MDVYHRERLLCRVWVSVDKLYMHDGYFIFAILVIANQRDIVCNVALKGRFNVQVIDRA